MGCFKNWIYVGYSASKTLNNGDAVVINLFPEVTIQAGKNVELDIRMPLRSDTDSWEVLI